VVLKKSSLSVFKDQRHYMQEPTNIFNKEEPTDLKDAAAVIPSDYTKRKNVFRIKLANGAEYLFESKSQVSTYGH